VTSHAWIRIPVATSWCHVDNPNDGGSIVTACRGRCALTEDYEIHDAPPDDERCQECVRVKKNESYISVSGGTYELLKAHAEKTGRSMASIVEQACAHERTVGGEILEHASDRASRRLTASALIDPVGASLKRIAWAYGCAKKGSDEEAQLQQALLEKAARTNERGDLSDTEPMRLELKQKLVEG
jgi:hypothetical protein